MIVRYTKSECLNNVTVRGKCYQSNVTMKVL